MLVIREETLRDVGQVRMISTAAFEQPDEAFMVRVLQPAARAAQLVRVRQSSRFTVRFAPIAVFLAANALAVG